MPFVASKLAFESESETETDFGLMLLNAFGCYITVGKHEEGNDKEIKSTGKS